MDDKKIEMQPGIPTAMVLAYMSEVLGGLLAICENLTANVNQLSAELKEDNDLESLVTEPAEDTDNVSDNG